MLAPPHNATPSQPVATVERPARPETRGFSDIPVVVQHDWTHESTKQAINQHDVGYFYGSAQLSESMLRDDRVASTLETRILGLVGCDRDATPPEGYEDDAEAIEAAAELKARWDEMIPDDVTKGLIRWVTMLRFALAEVLWSGDETGWSFKLKLWHPQFVWYDVSRRQYVVNTQEGPVWIEPGNGKWFLWAPDGFYRGWIMGAVRSLADPWLARTFNFRDWQRYNEVHGLPIRKIKIPSGAPEPEKDAFFNRVAHMGSNNTIACPQGVGDDAGANWDVELVEAEAGEWEAFEAAKKDCDTRISIRVLGQNLTTEVEGGAYSAAQVHNLVRLDYKRADNRSFMGALCEQVLRLWCVFNWGRPEIAPDTTYLIDPPEDRKSNADTLGIVATAATNLASAPEVDRRKLLEQYEIPLLDPDKVPPPAAPAESFAPGDGGGNGSGGDLESMARTLLAQVIRQRAQLARVTAPPASKAAQDYVEDVASIARDKAAAAMKPNVQKVLDAIGKAASFDELRALLGQTFDELDPTALAEVTEHALILSQLAGRHAIAEDPKHAEP